MQSNELAFIVRHAVRTALNSDDTQDMTREEYLEYRKNMHERLIVINEIDLEYFNSLDKKAVVGETPAPAGASYAVYAGKKAEEVQKELEKQRKVLAIIKKMQ